MIRIPFVNYGEIPSARVFRDMTAAIKQATPLPAPGSFLTTTPGGHTRRVPKSVAGLASASVLPNTIFAINLVLVDGSAGTFTDACTFKYNLFALSDTNSSNPLNVFTDGSTSYTSAIGPLCSRARVFKAPVTPSGGYGDGDDDDDTTGSGTAYYDPSGDIVLWDCDEGIDTTPITMVTQVVPTISGSDISLAITSVQTIVFGADASTSTVTTSFGFETAAISYLTGSTDSSTGCIDVSTNSATFLTTIDTDDDD
jgi:hypothetical protein